MRKCVIHLRERVNWFSPYGLSLINFQAFPKTEAI